MNGHLQIKKVYKDERPDEVVVDDANTLSDGFYRTLIDVFRNDGSDDVEDLRAAYFQVGSGDILSERYPPSYIGIDYTPSDVTGNIYEELTIWLPSGVAPPDGWPIYITTQYDSWKNKWVPSVGPTVGPTSFPSNWLLSKGVAVVNIGLTGSDGVVSPLNETSGTGTFCPPSDTISNRWSNNATSFGVKDLTWVIQYLRYNAATYNFNPNLIIGNGQSAGAQTMMWVGTQEFASGTAEDLQLRESTLLQGMYIKNGMFWFPVFEQDINHVCAWAFPTSGSFNGNFELLKATKLEQTWNGGAHGQYQVLASTFYSSFNTTEKETRMKTFPICFVYNGTNSEIVSSDISLHDTTPPLPQASGVDGMDAHSSWSGYAMYERLRNLNPDFHNTYSRLICDSTASSNGNDEFDPSAFTYDTIPELYSLQQTWFKDVFNLDDSESNFYELSKPLLFNTSYGLATDGGVENLDQIVAYGGNFSDSTPGLTTISMPFAKMMPDNITKITPNGAHHRIEIDLAMANGQTISEVGLFAKNPEGQPNDSPLMMAYKTFTPLTKESDFSFVFDWTIYL